MEKYSRLNMLRTITGTAALLALGTPALAQTVKIDGSSTVFPVTEAVAEDFQKTKKGAVRVTVGISGTGGGFKKFCRGETDISNASRPILKAEIAETIRADRHEGGFVLKLSSLVGCHLDAFRRAFVMTKCGARRLQSGRGTS